MAHSYISHPLILVVAKRDLKTKGSRGDSRFEAKEVGWAKVGSLLAILTDARHVCLNCPSRLRYHNISWWTYVGGSTPKQFPRCPVERQDIS